MFLGNLLVEMYGKCGKLEYAQWFFGKMPRKNVFSWTAIIAAHANHGQRKEAVHLFIEMLLKGVKPDKVTFCIIIKACSDAEVLTRSRLVHACIMLEALESDASVSMALITMYSSCKSLEDAYLIFVRFHSSKLLSIVDVWTPMIRTYAQHGHTKKAFDLFYQIQQDGMRPTEMTFLAILIVCSTLEALGKVKLIHSWIIVSGFGYNVHLGNALVNVYNKSGYAESASMVFRMMAVRDLVSWNCMITTYVQHTNGKVPLLLFRHMIQDGVKPDSVTFLSVLNSCSLSKNLACGKFIHAFSISHGFLAHIAVATTVLDMYAKSGSLNDAIKVFLYMRHWDAVSWNAMIAAYAQHGYVKEATRLFEQMPGENLEPSGLTFVGALSGCCCPAALAGGKVIHAYIISVQLDSDIRVTNALINMYGKCNSLGDAYRLFITTSQHDIISWNALMTAYTQCDHEAETLSLFGKMRLQEFKPTAASFISALNACINLANLAEGKLVHAILLCNHYEVDDLITSALFSMYGRCGNLVAAHMVFNNFQPHDTVIWTAMISAYTEHGLFVEALNIFYQMLKYKIEIDDITLSIVLSSCTSLTNLALGRLIHVHVLECGYEKDSTVGSALLNMYGRCGSLADAQRVFAKLHYRDVVSWSAMLATLAQHGDGKDALELFEQMQDQATRANNTTFMILLSACAHAGLVNDGCHYFISIAEVYSISYEVEHYGCMIDLLDRAGWLKEVQDLVNTMAISEDVVVWIAFLGHSP